MKTHLLFFILTNFVFFGLIKLTPAQDPCLGIVTVSAGVTNSFSLTSGEGMLNANCSGSNEEGKEIIYEYTATITGIHAIDILSNNNTVSLALMFKESVGGCNSAGWTCITGGFIYTNSYYLTLVSGTTYYFMFDRTNSTGGTLNSSFKITAPGTVDPCTVITNIPSCGVTMNGSMGNGLGFINTQCFGGNEYGEEMIFSFTPTMTGLHALDLLTNNNGDVMLLAWKNSTSGCNSTGWTCIGEFNYTPSYYLNLKKDTIYYFLFDKRRDNPTNTESFSFKITCPGTVDPCSVITNIPSCGVTMNGTMGNGLGFIDNQCFGGHEYGEEVIFSYTATVTGMHSLDVLTNNNGDVILFALKNAIGGCNSTGWTCVQEFNFTPSYYLNLKKDTTYYFLFDKRRDNPTNSESFSFKITCPGTVDPCAVIMDIPSCGTTMSATMGNGLGFIDTQCFGGHEYGEETIFSYTATVTGMHSLDILTNNNGDVMLFAWKNAIGGCNSTGWTCVQEFNFTPSYYLNLKKDTIYFFLFDKRRDNPTNSESFSFKITCPGTVDPCTVITGIPSCGTTISTTLGNGLGFIDAQCFGGHEYGEEAIFSYTSTVTGMHSLDLLTNNNGDAMLFAWKNAIGGCNSTGWTCVQEFTFTPSYYLNLKKDTTYYFLFDKRRDNPTNSSAFSFMITCPGTIDPCTEITPITTCNEVFDVTLGSGLGFINTQCFGGNEYGKEAIFSFTPAQTGTYSLDVLSNNNSFVLLFAWKPASSGCNSTGWTCAQEFNFTPSFSLSLTAGIAYYFLFDNRRDNPTGNSIFSFKISCPTTGDPCLDIITIPECGSSFNISLTTGTGLLDPNCSGANEQGKEQLFSFTPDVTGLHAIGITSNNSADALSLSYKEAAGGCNGTGWNCINNGFTSTPEYFITLTGGTEYLFLFDRLYNFTTNTENFTAKFICQGSIDPCADIKPISCGVMVTDTITSSLGFLNSSCSGSDEEGEEKIYFFTAAATGTHTIDFQSNNNADWMAVLYKEAGSGCTNTGWNCLSNSFTGTGNLNVTLTAGVSYYFMFDREFINQATDEIFSFILICLPNTIFNVTGGGGYCTGGTGLTVGLNGSETGVDYQLKKDGIAFGSTTPGTGSPLSWTGLFAGTYTVDGITALGTIAMNGSAIVSVYPLTVAGEVTGGETLYHGMEATLTLTGNIGSVLKWQKRWNSGTWQDLACIQTTYSEVPDTTGVWDYRAEVRSGNCSTLVSTFSTVTVQPVLRTINLTLYLEGLFNPLTNEMNKVQDEFGDKFPGTIADLIQFRLAKPANPFSVYYSVNDIDLNQDGTCSFTIPRAGYYYLVVRHRNSIETWSSVPVSLLPEPVSYDFSTISSQAYGDNLKEISGNWVIWGGDVNQDGIVDTGDMNPVENQSTAVIMGYVVEDVNGDGIVDTGDMNIVENNSTAVIQVISP